MGPMAAGGSWKFDGEHLTTPSFRSVTGLKASPSMPHQKHSSISTPRTADGSCLRLLEAFGITVQDLQHEQYDNAVCNFLSIIPFQYPKRHIAERSPHAYYYHFEEVSPHPGPTFGVCCHCQYALYMYNLDIDNCLPNGKHVVHQLARISAANVYGKVPWERYGNIL